ncbi:MAG: TetR/AcrR family transcriptional regulator [Prevotellaceae bacterium]|jgi:AcrR family transcriptional regulator|nr:TetR/AcrR family transcriptional regulator [Prevotellaceae bacterium]
MGILKTKQMLVDVARQLFAKDGKSNVTMNDIAIASQKGRRTLYTYFKSKNDIYLAVIERELDFLMEKLESVILRNMKPDEMLVEYIFTRQKAIKESVTRNGSLRADFFRDIYEVERARRRVDISEIKMIRKILEDGVRQQIFNCDDTELGAMIILYSLKGIETPFIRDRISKRMEDRKEQIIHFLFEGLKIRG